jgi:hypothetical protein
MKEEGMRPEIISTEVIISDKGRLHAPPPQVPAKRFGPPVPLGMTAIVWITVLVKPVLTAVQIVPLLVERNTPSRVPAKRPACPPGRSVPETARDMTSMFLKPVLTALQLVPLLVERNTPL